MPLRTCIRSAARGRRYSGYLAKRSGYVNRAFPDTELDSFVEALAVTIASFDKQAIAETKRLVNIASLPPDSEIAPEWDAVYCLGWPPRQSNQVQGIDGARIPPGWRC
jgi:enoyl-CoA hydratase/carnithine racemase